VDNKEGNSQSPCCENSNCCSSTSGDCGNRSSRWKSVIFTAVIIMASAVAAYSLFWRDQGSAPSACCPTGSSVSAIAVAEYNSIAGLDATLAGSESALVVLLHIGDVLSERDSAAISDVRAAMALKGSQVPVWTFKFGDPAFLEAINRFNVTKFPAVLVRGKYGTVVLYRDNIQKDTILSIFEQKSATLVPNPSGSGTR